MSDQLENMSQAYELAMRGWGRVSPNPMVGAVLVKAGKVIALGWHPFCGGPHAEAMAIAKAGAKAQGADLYVTLEPCSHFGKTPPCTQAIIDAGITKVFVGVKDPNPRMNGKSIALLKKAGIHVEVGFLEDELLRLNESFNKHVTSGMPFVTAKIAQTIDGKIANTQGDSKWITGQEARDYAHELRFGFDAILVGINTVLKDDPALNSTPRKNIKKIILDTHLKMPSRGKIYTSTRPEDILIFTAAKKTKTLNATVIVSPLKDGRIDLEWVLRYLGKMEVSHVLIEGGAKVVGNALNRGLVDKMMIYIAPKIMGAGIDAIAGVATKDISKMLKLKDVQAGRIGEDLFIEARIKG